MSGTNANIPLAFNPSPIGPNIGAAIQNANQLLQFKQAQEQVGRQNALRSILGTPGAIDATGNPTPETLTRVMGVDPSTGLQLQQNALVTQQRKLQMDALTTKTAFDTASNLNDAYAPILEQYKENVAKGMPPDAAMHEAQEATASTTDRLRTGGGLPPNVAQTLPTKFDPGEFERKAMQSSNYMNWWKEQQAQKKDVETEQRSGEQTWTDASGKPFILRPNMPAGQNATYLDGSPVPQEALGGSRKAGATQEYSNPVSVQYKGDDGKTVTVEAQQNKQTGAWVTADQNRTPLPGGVTPVKPLVPGSAAADRAAIADDLADDPLWKDKKPGERAAEVERQVRVAQGLINTPDAIDTEAHQIASYSSPPLSGYALRSPDGIKIMARVQELDPNYSAPEYNNINKTVTNFGSGKQGDTIRYINNAIQHIDVMQKAADALGSGDVRSFNTFANAIGREFGVPAPTTFDGLRQIVGTEIERAATGGVGAAIDRDRLIESLNKSNSPDQLKDVFKNFKALFGGQAASLRTQYESGTPDRPAFRGDGPFAFDKKLLPETRRELPGFNGAAGGGSVAQAGSAFTAGAKATPDQLKTLPKPTTPADIGKLGLKPGDAFVTPTGVIGIVPGSPPPAATPAPAAAPTPTSATPYAPNSYPGAAATASPAPAAQPAKPAPAAATGPGTAAAPLPLTKGMKQTDLVAGKIYSTRYGPATWDGKQFTTVQ